MLALFIQGAVLAATACVCDDMSSHESHTSMQMEHHSDSHDCCDSDTDKGTGFEMSQCDQCDCELASSAITISSISIAEPSVNADLYKFVHSGLPPASPFIPFKPPIS